MTTKIELPEQAQRLLSTFDGSPHWMKRRDIAHRLGKTRLNPSDTAILDMLAYMRLIEVDKREINSPIGYEYIYRLA